MGMLLCRNSIFWRSLTMLLLLLFAAVNAEEDTENKNCFQLTEGVGENIEVFLTCAEQKMMIQKVKNSYPVADFSNFTQDEFDNMTTVKTDLGKSTNFERLFCGNFLVRNSDIYTIKFGFYSVKNSPPQSFVLENNQFLTNVTITTTTLDSDYNVNMTFTVKNNKRLSNESLEALRALNYYNKDTSYIQEFGECSLNQDGLSSVEDLEDCHYTTNDLVINHGTDLSYKEELVLDEVRGCIRIKSSEIKDLSVINSIKKMKECSDSHEIINNTNLCLHPEAVFELKKRFKQKLQYNNNSNCSGICNTDYFFQHKDPACEIINGTLKIENKEEKANLTYLASVKEIRGRLVMTSNKLPKLNLFPNLELVNGTMDSKDDKAAIEVRFNNKLVDFTLPKNLTILSGKLQPKLQVMENGNFTISEERKKELEDEFGQGTVLTDVLERQIIYNDTSTNSSSSSDSDSDEKAVSTKKEVLTEDHRNIIIGAIGGALALSVLIYFCVVVAVVFKKRKAMLKVHRTYECMNMTELKIPAFDYPAYPFVTTKRWITEAAKILEKNVTLIKNQEKDRLKIKMEVPHIFVQKNSNPVLPLYSRTDHVHQEYVHEIGTFDSSAKIVVDKNGKKALRCVDKECASYNQKADTHPMYCMKKCECSDFGVKEGDNAAYGVRMEQVPVKNWNKNELEKIHHLWFDKIDRPITYEELSISTVREIQKEGKLFLEEELKYQEIYKTGKDTCILGVIDFKQKKVKRIRGKTFCERFGYALKKIIIGVHDSKVVKLANKGCFCSYKLTLYKYNGMNDTREDLSNLSVTPKPPNIGFAITKTFFTLCCMGPVENSQQFLEDMINANMSCPVSSWLTNYNEDDVIKLCEMTKNALDSDAYVEVDEINVRIVGEIRGKFETLRKALSMPSVNAGDGHPLFQTKHVFLGNYAGNHQQNMEVLCLLFALKCRFGKRYTLLRGALDWREMGDVSGLMSEIFTRFPERANEVWTAVNQVFDQMPLVCKVGKNILCTNAGIAPRMKEVKKLSLPIHELVPDTLPFNLMFAQPNWTVKRFFDNVEQKAGYYFGYEAFATALKDFNCDALFCTKKLDPYGVTGWRRRLYTLCSFNDKDHGYIAQAEYDAEGALEIQILEPGRERIKYNEAAPRVLDDAQRKATTSYMNDVIPKSKMGVVEKKKSKSSDTDKSTSSVMKTQADSVISAAPPDAASQSAPSQNAPSAPAAAGARSRN